MTGTVKPGSKDPPGASMERERQSSPFEPPAPKTGKKAKTGLKTRRDSAAAIVAGTDSGKDWAKDPQQATLVDHVRGLLREHVPGTPDGLAWHIGLLLWSHWTCLEAERQRAEVAAKRAERQRAEVAAKPHAVARARVTRSPWERAEAARRELVLVLPAIEHADVSDRARQHAARLRRLWDDLRSLSFDVALAPQTRWHALARALFAAVTESNGDTRGQAITWPVLKFLQEALAIVGEPHEADAIRKALSPGRDAKADAAEKSMIEDYSAD